MSTTEMPRNPGAPADALAGALVALFAVGTPAAWVYFSQTQSVVGLSDGVRYYVRYPLISQLLLA